MALDQEASLPRSIHACPREWLGGVLSTDLSSALVLTRTSIGAWAASEKSQLHPQKCGARQALETLQHVVAGGLAIATGKGEASRLH